MPWQSYVVRCTNQLCHCNHSAGASAMEHLLSIHPLQPPHVVLAARAPCRAGRHPAGFGLGSLAGLPRLLLLQLRTFDSSAVKWEARSPERTPVSCKPTAQCARGACGPCMHSWGGHELIKKPGSTSAAARSCPPPPLPPPSSPRPAGRRSCPALSPAARCTMMVMPCKRWCAST